MVGEVADGDAEELRQRGEVPETRVVAGSPAPRGNGAVGDLDALFDADGRGDLLVGERAPTRRVHGRDQAVELVGQARG
ncbi:MAG: hypothetical protein M3443_18150 [Actinomycetota bacterium]|nr:hypothetical protein [Actinomycetota bacterium]